jgi:hypothetical protein
VPAVPIWAAKLDWPASASTIASVPPVLSVVSSVTEPASGPVIVGTSSVPVTVKVIVAVEVAPAASRIV